jgi:hypothetical protein
MGDGATSSRQIRVRFDNRTVQLDATSDIKEGEMRLKSTLAKLLDQVGADPSFPPASKDRDRVIVQKGPRKSVVLKPESEIYDGEVYASRPPADKGRYEIL